VSPFIINGDTPLYTCLLLPIIGDTLNQTHLTLGSSDPKSLCNRVLFSLGSWRYFLLRQPSIAVLIVAPQSFLDPSAPQEFFDPSAPRRTWELTVGQWGLRDITVRIRFQRPPFCFLVVSHTAATRAVGKAASPTSPLVPPSLPPTRPPRRWTLGLSRQI
jgi:hypothetical protein